jgi:hypothetical protein
MNIFLLIFVSPSCSGYLSCVGEGAKIFSPWQLLHSGTLWSKCAVNTGAATGFVSGPLPKEEEYHDFAMQLLRDIPLRSECETVVLHPMGHTWPWEVRRQCITTRTQHRLYLGAERFLFSEALPQAGTGNA